MSAHTPGPWHWCGKAGDMSIWTGQIRPAYKGATYLVGENCVVGGCGCCDSPFGAKDEVEAAANARLIAAAPELLDALIDALCALEVCGRNFDHVMGKARDAIAKATGAA